MSYVDAFFPSTSPNPDKNDDVSKNNDEKFNIEYFADSLPIFGKSKAELPIFVEKMAVYGLSNPVFLGSLMKQYTGARDQIHLDNTGRVSSINVNGQTVGVREVKTRGPYKPGPIGFIL